MDLRFVSQHAISGCLPVFIALSLYFIVLRLFGKKQHIIHISLSFVLCLYFIGVCTVTGLCLLPQSFSPRIVIIPFVDMIRGPIDSVLNVILFIPLGLFLPMLYKRYDRIGKVALTGFFVSLSIELAQMFGAGSSDINDLITNTAGACLGYLLFKLLEKVLSKPLSKLPRAQRVNDYLQVTVLWIGTLLLMISAQYFVYKLLF